MNFKSSIYTTVSAVLFSTMAAHAVPISATFNGTLQAEPVDSYMAMFYGTPDFRFDGATYEITIHGDTDTVSNYNSSYRGSSQKYDYSRFDVTVDVSVTNGFEDISIVGQAAQITFHNFLNESPWGDLININFVTNLSNGDYVNLGLRQLSQAATSVIWDTDGFITSLSTLTDPNFDPNGIARGYMRDSNDASAEYMTGALNTGAASVSAVPLPAPALLLLGSFGVLAGLRRKRHAAT